ncbi:MAG TPA: TlpA disulfide reductase family protein [Thermodesulfovibrionales bacterium]|nr:TlpA disulfide reductase family protein [Thermodesulfovibrionales bacterium]
MNMFRFLLIGSLFLLIAMGPNPSTGGGRETASQPNADKSDNSKAPDFTLKDLQGRPLSLFALKGKVVLLNFWATWCPPCKAEMPSMNKLYNDIKARGFEVISISTDNSLSTIREFLSKNRLDFPVLFDENKSVTRLYHVFSMPTTFLIEHSE